MAERVWVVDGRPVGRPLSAVLGDQGYLVRLFDTAGAALAELPVADRPDLVLVERELPDRGGVELCGLLRAALPEAVLVMVSEHRDEMDVVTALDAGADDYQFTPFRTAELLARLRAHLRRANVTRPAQLVVGALRVDQAACRCLLGTSELTMRPREFDLLACLAASHGRVVLREELISRVWDEHWDRSSKTLDVHIGLLRKTLASASARTGVDAPVIATVRSRGYRLDGS